MSYLHEISLYQFRNYSQFRQLFSERIICISGRNGVGKTNLIDAVYLLCFTKSYFTSLQKALQQSGAEGYRVSGIMARNEEQHQLTCIYRQGKKEFLHDDIAYEKLGEHIGKYSAVMIAPDDLAFINESGEERRKWMDGLLCQLDAEYLSALLLYQKVLAQRNAWLKMPSGDSSTILDFYDQQLQQCGDYIYIRRNELLQRMLLDVQELYEVLSGSREQVSWTYESQLHGSNMQQLLKRSLQHDFRTQRTQSGIHRDDVDLLLNGEKVKNFASQGQKKSLLFAVKLSQYFLLAKEREHAPILLLDDVFEKLDLDRIQALMQVIRRADVGQVFITDTDQQRLKNLFGADESVQYVHIAE